MRVRVPGGIAFLSCGYPDSGSQYIRRMGVPPVVIRNEGIRSDARLAILKGIARPYASTE